MKNRKLIISLIVILSIIAVLLIIFLIGLLNNRFSFSFPMSNYKVSKELIFDEIYDFNFSSINIEADASDIHIKASSDSNTRVVVYSDKENTVVDTNNQELKIKSKTKKCIGICFNFKVSKIEVYLPENYDKDIRIVNKFGDIDVGEFLNSNMEIHEDCGDVSILGGNKVTVNNKYGDIKVKQANEVNIKESAGDVSVTKVKDATIENNFGDIMIQEVTNYLDVKNDCGDIEINWVSLQKNSKIENNLGDIEIGKTNEIYIDAKTSLGDVDINQNYRLSDITLTIRNDCGDIKVKN